MDSTKQSLSIPMDCTENEKENFESEVKLQIKEKTVKFGEKPYTFVYVKDVDQSIWFVGNCIAEMLGYTNRPKAISQNVSTTNVKQFCELEPLELKMAHSIQKMSKFINETGLFEFITKSKMPNTTEFKNWINDDVLPQLKMLEEYNQSNEVTKINVNEINNTDGIWFVAKDMAIMLEYKNHKEAIRHHVFDYNIQTFEGGEFHDPWSDPSF